MRAFTLIIVLAASVIAAPLSTESETVHADGWGGYVNSHHWCVETTDTLLESSIAIYKRAEASSEVKSDGWGG
jgi:hypothetical protein